MKLKEGVTPEEVEKILNLYGLTSEEAEMVLNFDPQAIPLMVEAKKGLLMISLLAGYTANTAEPKTAAMLLGRVTAVDGIIDMIDSFIDTAMEEAEKC